MPSPEHGPRRPDEQPRRSEHEPVAYHRTALFRDEPSAGGAYAAAQQALFEGPPNDLSAYRFQLNSVYHVAILGEPPPTDLDAQLTEILSVGEPATLPPGVLAALAERRRRMSRGGGWTEGHYRPGKRL